MGAARDVAGGVRYDLQLVNGAEHVPAILLVPHTREPAPAALLLHGFGSQKERMADTMGLALMSHGVCALAVDLPMHGARTGDLGTLSTSNAIYIVSVWRAAVREALTSLRYLESHESVDARFIGLVGYSLGSFLANIVAGGGPAVRAVVLAASGDLPEGLPFESRVRAILDPLRAIRRLAGRQLLMVNGRFDRTVKPSQAERLFAAAEEPKAIRWYGGGHWPPPREIAYAAEWLAQRLTPDARLERRKA